MEPRLKPNTLSRPTKIDDLDLVGWALFSTLKTFFNKMRNESLRKNFSPLRYRRKVAVSGPFTKPNHFRFARGWSCPRMKRCLWRAMWSFFYYYHKKKKKSNHLMLLPMETRVHRQPPFMHHCFFIKQKLFFLFKLFFWYF